MRASVLSLLSLAAFANAAKKGPSHLNTLVTFGDSYTDTVVVSNNGTQWPVYATGYAHATLRPFARSGGTCTNTLTPRTFPSVMESQMPLYLEEIRNKSLKVDFERALYTLWIGTNDLGPNTLLTGVEVEPNATIASVTSCTIDWAKELYDTGARNFLYQNIIPLERLPIYAVDSYPNRYWTAQRNTTEWNLFIRELQVAGNAISRLMWEALPAKLPHAHIGYFDSHALFLDILTHPTSFLNGTLSSPNITGAVNACVFQLNESTSGPADCTVAQGSDKDSFMWYDELHPSEQVDRVVAREIANVLEGKGSKYATWFS
ncbi:carbohydrate esterase family 16 protein [Peniophora sp. CONT]|nr:carbohydrate esterase family 16 protein [Peniophora sp. CONT]